MIRASIFLVILITCTSSSFFAQENIPLQLAKKRLFSSNYIEYRTSLMFRKMPGKMYFREKGTDDVYRKIGFYGKNLKPYILGESESMKHFKRYRFKKAIEDFTVVGMGITGAVYIGFAFENLIEGHGVSDSFFGRKNVAISIATYLLMVVGNGHFGPSSENDLLHSILLGNGFLRKKRIGLNMKFEDKDKHTVVGLTLSF